MHLVVGAYVTSRRIASRGGRRPLVEVSDLLGPTQQVVIDHDLNAVEGVVEPRERLVLLIAPGVRTSGQDVRSWLCDPHPYSSFLQSLGDLKLMELNLVDVRYDLADG